MLKSAWETEYISIGQDPFHLGAFVWATVTEGMLGFSTKDINVQSVGDRDDEDKNLYVLFGHAI